MEWDVFLDEDFDAWLETLEAGLQDEIWANIEVLRHAVRICTDLVSTPSRDLLSRT